MSRRKINIILFAILPAIMGGLAIMGFIMNQGSTSSGITGSIEPSKNISAKNELSVVQDRLDNLIGALEQQKRYNLSLEKRIKEEANLEKRLDKLTAELSDIRNIEDLGWESDDQADADSQSDKDPMKISDKEFGQLLDQLITDGGFDEEFTDIAIGQTQEILAEMPGVNLDDMKCGVGFCRAVFSHENGERPEIRGIFGRPPFMNDSTSIYEPDGSISLYFTEPGVSLGDLKLEVLAEKGIIPERPSPDNNYQENASKNM